MKLIEGDERSEFETTMGNEPQITEPLQGRN